MPSPPEPPEARVPTSRRTTARLALIMAMLAVVVAVSALAYWDGRREAAASLGDFADAQTTVARALGAELGLQLRSQPGLSASASPRELFAEASAVEQPGRRVVLLFAPGSGERARALDGRTVEAPALAAALREGRASVRLTRPEAAAIGLPERTAAAGLTAVDGGASGRWGVAVVSTQAGERDREIRAGYRLVLTIALTSGLVLAFGIAALRVQKRELDLERELSLAQALHHRDEALVRAERAATMGTFAMGIAHELGTPLGVIAGRTEQLLARSTDERTTRGLTAIREQADHIGSVVRGFLGLARGDAPAVAPAASGDVARSAIRLVEHRFREGAAVAVDVPAGLPDVRCDVRLIEHALVNLLLNAHHAAPTGHVRLSVRADDDAVSFEVVDDGTGITAEDAARALEPFFTTKPRGEGTGLGLAIANEIAKIHRGTLSIGPAAPRGTRACLTIPVREEEPPDAAT